MGEERPAKRLLGGAIRRLLSAAWNGGPDPAAEEFLRHRRHFHAALPDGPLAAQHYVVFDLEATGLKPSHGDVMIAIGAVRLRNLEIVDRFETLVDPGRPIPPRSTRYHGITDAMVAGSPPPPAAVAAFAAFAEGAVLVAHNAGFDRTLLHMAEFAGAPPIPNPVLCSLAVSHWLDPEEADHSLDGLCARAGIVIARRHAALGDAEATAELWRRLIARAAARGVEHLPELVRRTGMERFVSQMSEAF
ncbi:MAG: 3'-5' exonuclease [Acetobacteraceae bacterium]|nr:3'-5' exonuclease [Acetobacteraceae bacterium]MDW8397686.1 3'-5' exonuclease [Acetobacteraceae bacterium]